MQQKEENINSFWVAYGDAVVDSGIPEAIAKIILSEQNVVSGFQWF